MKDTSKELLEHPNKTEALDNQILRVLVGSGVHGLAVEGTDDRDEMGIYIERPHRVYGVHRPLESVVLRTQPDGARSGPGDLDLMLYSLRHWMRLALQGNPSILTLLYAPIDAVLLRKPIGTDLLAMDEWIVSKNAGPRFLGYLDGQRERLTGGGKRNRVPNRPELIERYGFDVKYASHALRLGLQGIELLSTGRLTLPMREEDREVVYAVKTGGFTYEQSVQMIDGVREQLRRIVDRDPRGLPNVLRDEPDRAQVATWMRVVHEEHWATSVTR